MTQIKSTCRECGSNWIPRNTQSPEECQCPKCGSGRVFFEQTSFTGIVRGTNIETSTGCALVTIALSETGTANELTSFLLGDKVEVSHDLSL